MLDSAGDLYGAGGSLGGGSVFEIAHGSGTITTLASFNGTDGYDPNGDLVMDAAGNLYGTAADGGPGYSGPNTGDGTVFEVAKGSGTITTLASFNGTDGIVSNGGLVLDAAGNLYGTAGLGGPGYSSGASNGDGTVFEVAKGSGTITTLASFDGADGEFPTGGLALDAAGNLYGTTDQGGADNDGTVFEIARGSSTITTLASFDGNDGKFSSAGPVLDAAGDLFGTAFQGGANDAGTVFEIVAGSDIITTLASFDVTDGQYPGSGLTIDSGHNLFGEAGGGGADDDGTVFELAASSPNQTPTYYTVNLLSDTGASSGTDSTTGDPSGDLLWAVTEANANTNPAGSVINFDPTVFAMSQTIALSSTLDLDESAGPEVINGPGSGLLAVDGEGRVTVFDVKEGTTASISGLTVSGGSASTFGGGVYTYKGTVNLSACTISGNSATKMGGGLTCYLGTMTVTDCTISGNSAGIAGGGMTGYNITLTDCTINGNSAGGIGGGVNVDNMTLTDCTITGNSAGDNGGGLYGIGTLTGCTVSGNSSGYYGGGFCVGWSYKPATTLVDTIVAGNTAPTDADIDVVQIPQPNSIDGFNNLIGIESVGGLTNGVDGNQVGVTNPGLGPLADNGGPTETMALLPGSPAIGAGAAVSGVATDQRGDPLDSPPDIGAYQLIATPTPTPTPVATTGSATGVTSTVATVNADVNPEGSATTVSFVYGTSSTLASGTTTTAGQSIGNGSAAVSVTAALTGLTAGATYYYEVVATSSEGTTDGSILSFATPAPTPTPTPASTPTSTVIIGEQPVFLRKLNKKGKPTGKAILGGFTLDLGIPLNAAAAANAANYQVDTITTKKVKKKKETILHPITKFTVSYLAASDAVEITLGANASFPTGGQITVSAGLTTASGGTLSGAAVFTVAKGGKTSGRCEPDRSSPVVRDPSPEPRPERGETNDLAQAVGKSSAASPGVTNSPGGHSSRGSR